MRMGAILSSLRGRGCEIYSPDTMLYVESRPLTHHAAAADRVVSCPSGLASDAASDSASGFTPSSRCTSASGCDQCSAQRNPKRDLAARPVRH